MRLIDEPALQPALRPVRLEIAHQLNPVSGEARPTQFRLIATHTGTAWKPIGCASDQYRLLDNREVVNAIDSLQHRFGLNLRPARAFADRGDGGQYVTARMEGTRSRIVLTDESKRYNVSGGGKQSVCPTVAFDNNYRPGSYGEFRAGTGVYICCNLMWHGGAVESTQQIMHKGARNSGPFVPDEIRAWVEVGLEKVAQRLDEDRKLIELLAATKIAVPELTATPLETVPDRQKNALQEALVRNIELNGPTGWAVMQAASEIVAHAWLRNGTPSWAALDWLDKAEALLLETDEMQAVLA